MSRLPRYSLPDAMPNRRARGTKSCTSATTAPASSQMRPRQQGSLLAVIAETSTLLGELGNDGLGGDSSSFTATSHGNDGTATRPRTTPASPAPQSGRRPAMAPQTTVVTNRNRGRHPSRYCLAHRGHGGSRESAARRHHRYQVTQSDHSRGESVGSRLFASVTVTGSMGSLGGSCCAADLPSSTR